MVTAGLFDWRRSRDAVRVIAGKWTHPVLFELLAGRRRHSDLLASLPDVSDKVLTETLRAMERNGLLVRHVDASVVPVRVDYELTHVGRSLRRPLAALDLWGQTYLSVVEQARSRAADDEG